jgi:hypothetical protein
MITLTRRQARSLRAVCRRSTLGITHRGPVSPLVLSVDGERLRVRHRHGPLAIEHAAASAWPSSGSVVLPLEALADLEGRDEATIALESIAADRTVARWSDRGIPQSREYVVAPVNNPFPEPPTSWTETTAGLLDALAEATATAADDDTRYALSCLALRGGSGAIAATDGRQALIQGGFSFPWGGDVLVRRSPLFACRDLPRDAPISLAKTDSHIVLRVGSWTIWLEVATGLRFPDVDRVLPSSSDAATRLRLDPADARFLLDAIDRLPGGDEPNSPATLDLNGRIAIRAKGPGESTPTELILSRSAYSGPPIRLQTNRESLARALRLGFAEVEVVDADTPLACRDGRRVFAWQPLSKDGVIEPAVDATRIESGPMPIPTPEVTSRSRDEPNGPSHPATSATRSNGVGAIAPGSTQPTPPVDLASLIRDAEALHAALGDVRSRAGRLVVALRKQRRRERLVAQTLASLRQIRLQDVTG